MKELNSVQTGMKPLLMRDATGPVLHDYADRMSEVWSECQSSKSKQITKDLITPGSNKKLDELLEQGPLRAASAGQKDVYFQFVGHSNDPALVDRVKDYFTGKDMKAEVRKIDATLPSTILQVRW